MALMAHSGCEEVHLGPQRQNDGKEGGFGQLQQTCAKARTVVVWLQYVVDLCSSLPQCGSRCLVKILFLTLTTSITDNCHV